MTQQLYIPSLGDELKVEKEWDFILFADGKNEKMASLFGYYLEVNDNGKFFWVSKANVSNRVPFLPLVIPAGSIIRTDRIEARRAASIPPCITFTCTLPKSKKKGKFWVMLKEANKLNFSEVLN